jgi:hypothetical protein
MSIKDFMKKQGKTLKDTTKIKPIKEFKNLSTAEKDALLEKLLRDLGYIN